MNNTVDYRESDEAIDFQRMFSQLWAGRWLIAGIAFLCTAGFTAAALLMHPVYSAAVVLTPASSDRATPMGGALGQLTGLASMAGIDLGGAGSAQTEEALAVLRSREFLEGFIIEQQLLPELFPKLWDTQAGRWNVGPDRQPKPVQGFKALGKLLSASTNKKTGLTTVALEWRDPARDAYLVNQLVARLNAVMRTRAIERTDAYLSYLREQLESTTAVETRSAIGRLMEAQINQRMLANVAKEYAFRVVDKALPPDRHDQVRPKRRMLVVLGGLIGIFLGIVAVLIRAAVQQARRGPGN